VGEWRLFPRGAALISFARYRQLLEPPELRRTVLSSLLGRLPIGMTAFALLLFVQSASGSFARGGAASACYVAGLALLAPVLGRAIDRHGPKWILLGCATVFPAALLALVLAVHREAPAAALLALAAVAGGSFPPITVCMRTYLKNRLANNPLLSAAYSLESVVIELVFIVGPMIVALFVAFSSADLAVLFAAACGSAGALLFLRSPALRAWRVEPRRERSLVGALGERGFIALIAVILCYSSAFGLIEIGLAAYATERGSPALAGVLLGLMSAGSAVGGLAYGSRLWHAPLDRQFAFTLGLMAAGLAFLALGWNPWIFAALSVLAGVVMAPALTIQAMLVARIARPQYVTEAFTWSASALVAGVGIGMALGGGLLEYYRSDSALAAGALSALLAAALAVASLRRA
jgi:MFS family permease